MEEKPGVMFVSPGLCVGGAEWWMLALAKYMDRLRCCGFLIAGDMVEPLMVNECRSRGIDFVISGEHVDCSVILSWGTSNVRKLVGPTTVPIVEVAHCCAAFNTAIEYMESAAWQANYLTAVSEAAKSAYPLRMRDQVKVIENGADPERVELVKGGQHYRERWGVEGKIVAYVGRLYPGKGARRLIRASRYLPKGWTTALVGNGPLRDECIALAREQKSRVVFEEAVSNVGDIYDAADVVCMPSKTEGLSLSMVEAWLAGVPVVATAFDNAVMLQDKWGKKLLNLVPIDVSSRKLAKAIVRAYGSDTEYARRIASEHYTANVMAQKWEDYLLGTVL